MDTSSKAITWMVLSAVLFIVLHPGVLLTIPSMDGTLASMYTPNMPSNQVIVHAIVFAILLNVVGGALKKAGLMGSKSSKSSTSSSTK